MSDKQIQVPIKTKDGEELYLQGAFLKGGKFIIADEKAIIRNLFIVLLFLLVVLFFIYHQLVANQEVLGKLIYDVCVGNQTLMYPIDPTIP